jgi:hypothetical protein
MRIAAMLLMPALLCAAPALQIVRPVVSQMEDGAADTPGLEHVPGETVYFMCRVAGYAKSPDEKIRLKFSVQAFDPKGVALVEEVASEITAEVGPQDKEWQPKIATEVPIPPLVGSGAYKIVVKVQDAVANTSAEASITFLVRGRDVAPSDTLVVRSFRFFRNEDDEKPLDKASYRPGDGVWARFDIIGFRYAAKNRIDVSYSTSVIAPGGRVLWTQPEPAAEQSESFYPKRYVPAAMGITLQNTIRPGEYTIAVRATDAVGKQVCEAQHTFTIE